MADSDEAKEYVLNDKIEELGQVVQYNEAGQLCLIMKNMSSKESGSDEYRVVSKFLERIWNVAETTARMMNDRIQFQSFENVLRNIPEPKSYQPGMDLSHCYPPQPQRRY